MSIIRTRKERERVWVNSIKKRGRKAYRFEREAWLEFLVVEDVRDKYLEKLTASKDQFSAIEAEIALLNEKIRMTTLQKEKMEYAQRIGNLQDDLQMIQGAVADFDYTYKLLYELGSGAKRLLDKDCFWEVVLAIPEGKLQRLARKDSGLEYIRELVEKIYGDIMAAEIRVAESRERHAGNKKRKEKVRKRSLELVGNSEKDKLEEIIKSAESVDNVTNESNEEHSSMENQNKMY